MNKNFFVVVTAVTMAGAASFSQPLGAESIAMAGVVSVLPRDAWSVYHNPAGLASLKQISCSSFLSPGDFGLSELRTIAGSLVLPITGGTIGMGVERFGFDLYNETSILAGYGSEITDRCTGGIAIRYRHLGIQGYGSEQSAQIQIGGLIDITHTIVLGFEAENLNAATVGKLKERLPQAMALGLRFEPSEQVAGMIEMEKDTRYPVSLKLGIRRRLGGVIGLSAGLADHPYRLSAGVELQYGWFSISWATYSHADLGWSHQMGLRMELGR